MQVKQNKIIGISYELHVGDPAGEMVLVEKMEGEDVFFFIYGNSGLPQGFEKKLAGKQVGETFKFSLTSEEGYGKYDEAAVIYVPRKAFEIEGKIEENLLEKGNFIPMTDDRGYQVQGKVLEIEKGQVLMDFNHPLVGMELHFEGKVENIREASPAEISQGHVGISP